MDLREFRKSQGMSLAEAAQAWGLRSKGYLSELETAGAASRPLALRLYREHKVKLPPIANLSDEEIAILDKLEGKAA